MAARCPRPGRAALLAAALALSACSSAPPAPTAPGSTAPAGSPSPSVGPRASASPGPGATASPAPRAAPASRYRTPAGQLHRKLLEFRTGARPKQVAFTPDGRQLWVTPLGSADGVEVYDATTGRRQARVRLGRYGAVEVVFDRRGRTAYVSQMESATVFAIDTRSLRVVRRYPTGGTWTKVLALSPDEKTLYASNWSSDDVSAITLATGRTRRYPTVRTPRGLYAAPDDRTLYVAGYADGEISRLDLRTGRERVLLRTGGAMRHLVGDPQAQRLYAVDLGTSRSYVVDLRTDRVRELAKTDRLPNTADLSPDGRVLYVSNRGRNGASYLREGPEWGSVVMVDARSGRYLDAVVGGNQSTGLDVSPDGTRLAFSDFLDDRVSVYEIPPHDELAAGDGGRYRAHLAELRKR